MEDWKHAHAHPKEALARLHHFSFRKHQASGEVEFHITIRENLHAEIGALTFFAEADKETNQKTVAYRPTGWSNTLGGALDECLKNIRRFDYQG